MNRRAFLGNTALFTAPMLLQGIPVFAGDGVLHPFLQALSAPAVTCGRILVVIQLNGGNDGLNMVIPLDRYTELGNARPGLLIPAASTLALNGTSTTALHPSMTGLRDLFNNGKVNLVQGVTYPNPNYSHFQAQDIWFSGSNTLPSPDTGWLGRDLDLAYPGFPTNYPSAADPDPLAIQIGGALPLSLQGPNINMGYNAPNPGSLVNVATGQSAPAPVSDYGTELTFLRLMKDQSNAYAARITAAYNAQATQSTMYAASGNSLSDQMKVVARLIGGGLKTPVYIVNHSDSFDTHVDQVGATPGTGYHANILSKLSVAIAAFQDDITRMNKADLVTGMTFSEFGRRVISNSSSGTDHGSGAPVIFFGAKILGGVTGTSPVLPNNPTGSTQVPLQFDFRQLYATVMQKWLCMTPAQSGTVLNGTFTTVPIFNPAVLASEGIQLSAAWNGNQASIGFEVYANDQYQDFAVERSTDGISFQRLNTIANATNNNQQRYQYNDDRISAPEIFYRIRGNTRQGSFHYSNTVRLKNSSRQEIRVYPNPVTNHTVNIEFLSAVKDNVSVTLFGTRGERLYYNQFRPGSSRTIRFKVPDYFDVQTLYLLRVEFDGNVETEKLIFQ